ncbi:MAG: hypothetical protein HY815_02600 [Candidatus Riflebacteria bacterium]|nr:hypothetical protein [Candidatus Riflebacteria bacterium]
MKTLIKLLLLPFKIIDDGLEFLIFKVLFHRRLWWLTLPLAIGGSIWAYQAWRDRAGAGPARPSPAPSAGPTASPTAGVPRPVAPSRTPAPPVTAPASGGPGLAESLTEGRSPSPSSSRSPAPSPGRRGNGPSWARSWRVMPPQRPG